MKAIDMTNMKVGRLLVISKDLNAKTREISWLCKCDCGNLVSVNGVNLRTKKSQSCGCLQRELTASRFRKHGHSIDSRFYRIWQNMKRRCDYPNSDNYEYYGGRGIKVCDQWYIFDNFYNDMYKTYIEHVKIHGEIDTTLDRIENDKNYEFSNCKWSTLVEQQANCRSAKLFIATYIIPGPSFGYTETSNNQTQFAEKYNLKSRMINCCLRNKNNQHCGWTFKYLGE